MARRKAMQVTLGVDSLRPAGAVLSLVAVFVSAVVTSRLRRLRDPSALLSLTLGMLS